MRWLRTLHHLWSNRHINRGFKQLEAGSGERELSLTPEMVVARASRKWGLLWRSANALDGTRTHIIHEHCLPVLFRTRSEARAYANERFGYIKDRPDLRAEPHGWRVPEAVRLTINVADGTAGRKLA